MIRSLIKSKLLLVVVIVFSFLILGNRCYAQFAGGRGTSQEPWLISTPEHLNEIRNYLGTANEDKYFKQINDIDLGVAPWNVEAGWLPIGSTMVLSFRGSYDGGYYTIRNLTLRRQGNNDIGLFGLTFNAQLSNIILDSVDVTGNNRVGGLVGSQQGGSIINCSVNGSVTGNDNVGGVVGITSANALIATTFNNAAITGRLRTAGLIGSTSNNSTVRNCYSTGNVDGASGSIGGLIGRNTASLIENCYSTGSVTTPSPYLGGLIGSQQQGTALNSYWDIEASGLENSSGGEGRTTDQMTFPYAENTYRNWDFNTIWRGDDTHQANNGYPFHLWRSPDTPMNLTAEGGDGEITLNWQAPLVSVPDEYNIYRNGVFLTSVEHTNYIDRDIINYYMYSYYVTASYPDAESQPSNIAQVMALPFPAFQGYGTEEDPYLVRSAGQLSYIKYNLEYNYRQTADIDLGVDPWTEAKGWVPIGYYVDYEHPDNRIFTGSYDGNGFKIRNLQIHREGADYQGLFGYVQGAKFSNVLLENVSVKGHQYVGGLIGYARDSIISQSMVSGTVQGTSDFVGGLVGYSLGIGNYITSSFSNAAVLGSAYVGGLVGYSTTTTHSISNCYAAGSVRGISNCVGGLVGYSWGDIRNSYSVGYVATTDTVHIGGLIGRSDFGTATNSYWNTESSSQTVSAGGSALNTLQMVQSDTYQNWNFEEIWAIEEGCTYPYFLWQQNSGSCNIPGPFNLRALPGSGIVRLNWQAPPVGTVHQYMIYKNNELLATIDAPNTGIMDNNVMNFATYTYYVVAELSNGRETASSNPVATIPFTFADGDGSINNPYLIESVYQLHAVKSQLSSHFRQVADIDLGSAPWITGTGWQPIGTTAVNSFTGSFNGGGYRIFNLLINDPGTDYQGLFGYVRGGVIQNVGIENGNVTGRDNVGGLVGKVSDGSIIENSFYYGVVTGTGVDIGGLAGTNDHSRISDCYAYGSVRANSHNVGGLVGWNGNSILENSYAMVDVEVTPITDFLVYDIGGLVGFNINNSLIRNCRAGGNVSAVRGRRIGGLVGDNSLTDGETGSLITNSYATGNVVADSWAGGFAGRNYSTPAAVVLSEIANSYSTGIVFTYSHNSGGFVGRNDNAVINRSYSKSRVTVQASNGPYNQGGLVGRNTIGGIINDCYAMGEVNGFARVGGLVGDNFRDTGDEVFITNSFSTGRVTRAGQLPIGGLAARNDGGTVTYSYWDVNTSGIGNSAAGSGRTTFQMTYPYNEETFINWDFGNIWKEDIMSTRNNGYPYFHWQLFVTTVAVRGNQEVSIPLYGRNRYRYEARIYDQSDRVMIGSIVIWSLEDEEGFTNVADGNVTIDVMGTVIVNADANEGAFIIRAVSDADSNVNGFLRVELIPSEVSPNPVIAVNPLPQHRAEAVDIELERLSWEYIEDIGHKNPTGFRIYMGTSMQFGEEFAWITYLEGQSEYSYYLEEILHPLTTYFWKVVPTTEQPHRINVSESNTVPSNTVNIISANNTVKRATADRDSKTNKRTASAGRRVFSERSSSIFNRGDAEHCPVWSFTTNIYTDIEDADTPYITSLHNNYPNPFNPETLISFTLAEANVVVIEIFNNRGQIVRRLQNGFLESGHHQILWNGRDNHNRLVASGLYFYRMQAGKYSQHKKMLLLR